MALSQQFQEECPKCGRMMSGSTANALKQNMALHLSEHEIEPKQEMAHEFLPYAAEQAKGDAALVLREEIATIVDKRYEANSVYIRVRSASGKEVILQYDAISKRLLSHNP